VRVLSYYFEYNAAKKVMAARFTAVTDEVLKEFFEVAPRYIAAHAVEAGIVDFTAVTSFDWSAETSRQLARMPPLVPDPKPRFIVAVSDVQFGMGRLFQQSSSEGREELRVVRSLDEAYLQLGISAGSFTRLA
jgi:hypothetical protein